MPMNTLKGLLITVVAALPATAMAQFAPRHTPGIMKKLPVAMEHPVNDTPEGTLYDNMAYANTYHYYGYDGEIENAESHAIITRYVMTSDSTIWWHNPITMQDGGWVRIDHMGGGKYVMHTPQCIIEDEDNIDEEGNIYKAFATRLVLKNFGDGYYYYPDVNEDGQANLDMHFTLNEDGELRQVNDSIVKDMDDMPYEVLALSNANGDWYGFSDGAMRVWRVNEQPTKLPEGIEPQRYVLTDSTLNQQTGHFSFTRQLIDMAIQGQDAYLAAPDGTGWIHGSITEDGSICLRPQYIGPAKIYGSHVWFEPATFQIDYDNEATDDDDEDEQDPYELDYELAPELVLHKTADGAYAANYPSALLINATKGQVLYAADYPVPSLTTFTEKPAVPATPKITEFYPYYEEDGSALFTVRIPVYDKNKEMLDPTLLSYVVYVNDDKEPYTFLPEDYQALTEPMTELSYWFNDGYDFSITDIGHTIYLYVDAERVGVQSIYRGAGEERRSDIGWDDGSVTTGLKTATTTKRIDSIYDIQGRKLQRLAQGVNIVRMTDGTTRKIIKR